MRPAHLKTGSATVLAALLLTAGVMAAETGAWLPGKRGFQVTVRKADKSTTKITVMLEPQETKSLLAPDGTKVEWFSVGNAVRIAKAFEKEGLLDDPALAKTIVGMVGAENKVPGGKVPGNGDASELCLTLRMPDGGLVHVGSEKPRAGAESMTPSEKDVLGSRYLLHPVDGGRIVHWSVDEAMQIKDALLARGYSLDDVMAAWVGMRWSAPGSQAPGKGQPASPATEVQPLPDKPLDPPCGQCQNGIWNDNVLACVQSGSHFNCTVCTICG